MVISIVYMYFRFWSGVVNPIAPEELPVDGNAWTTLSYGNGPGYDWGFRKDPNTVDTSKSNPWKCEIEIRDLTCFWSLKRKTFFGNMRWDWWGCVGGSVKEQPISIKLIVKSFVFRWTKKYGIHLLFTYRKWNIGLHPTLGSDMLNTDG